MKKIVLLLFVLFLNSVHAQSFLWAENIDSYPLAAATNTAGSIYTTGTFQGVVDFDPGTGSYTLGIPANFNSNLFVSKSDALGNYISAFAILVVNGQGYVQPNAIATDFGGNIFLTGTCLTASGANIDFDPGPGTYLLSASQPLCFIVKLDAGGNFLWAKTLNGSAGNSHGTSIIPDASGNVITGGYYTGITDFDPGPATNNLSAPSPTINSFVLKLDASGNFVWVKEIGGNSSVVLNALDLDGSGNMYFTGQYQGTADFDPGASTNNLVSTGGTDVFVLKLDGSGNFTWAQSIGGIGNNGAASIAVDAVGNSHLTGATSGITDYDPGAGTYTLVPGSTKEIFIMKLTALGNFSWAKTIGNATGVPFVNNLGASIDVDPWGNVYTTGTFNGTVAVDFDPGTGSYPVLASSTASWSGFISELDPSGNFLWAGTMGGGEGRSVITQGGNVYAAGIFNGGATDIDPTATTYSLPGFSDGFVLKLNGNSAYEILGPSVFCTGTVNATATYSVAQDVSNTYSWTVSPGAILNSAVNAFSVNVTLTQGPTTLAVTITNSTSATTSTVVVNVGSPPLLGVVASPAFSVCAGSTLNLSGTGAANYFWSGGITNNAPFIVNSGGNYTLTGISPIGCLANTIVLITANPLPNVSVNVLPSATICLGVTLNLSGTGASSYLWTGGITNNSPFTPGAGGTYTVTGTDANGCVNTATISTTVNSLPVVGGTALPSATVCSGSTLALSGNGANIFGWSGGRLNNVPFTATTSAVYTVTGTGTNGCVNTATVPVTVNPLPFVGAVLSPTAPVCAGGTLNLNGTGAITYTWTGNVSDNQPFSVMTGASYTVTGTDVNGCINSAVKSTTVYALPLVGAVIQPSLPVCSGATISLSGTGASTYTWTSGVTDGSPFTATSNITYSVTGTDVNGCANTAAVSASVNSLPAISVVVLPSPTVCAGANINLAGNGASTYTWSNGVINAVSFTPTASANYSLSATGANGCVSTATVTVVVNPQPVVITQPLSQATLVGSSAQFVVVSSNVAPAYQWQQNTGTGFSNLSNNAQFSGVNTPTLVVLNLTLAQNNTGFRCVLTKGDCSDTSDVGVLSVLDGTGIKERIKENYFKISPNPAADFCFIDIDDPGAGLIYSVTDQTGRLVLNGELKDIKTEVDLRSLVNGLYFIHLNNGHQKPLKLVKQ